MLNHNKLKQLRLACGWTPTQMLLRLAKEQGVYCSQSSLSQYELGRVKNPAYDVLRAMAKLYDVGMEDLQC